MQAEDIKNIAVIGAGLMGHGIAQIFASGNYDVRLLDVESELLSKALQDIRSNLSMMARKAVIAESTIDTIISRIKTTTNMAEAASDAQLVIEAVPENLELKQKIFHDLDQLCPPEAILATNTSVISITEIAAKARRRERILGTHFWNPPYMIPLVEVVKGRETSEEAMETTYQLLKKAGKHPVKVMKDVPGFVGNRLQHALWREAIFVVENGIAEPATVDEVVKEGFGIRLPVLGPLENADMVGLDMALAIHDYILKYLNASPNPSPLLRKKVEKGELGFKTGQGFYTWSAEEAQRSREKLLEYLLDRVRKEQQHKA
jgi:3-hydroxybutyryl-CoA dehydrogenase